MTASNPRTGHAVSPKRGFTPQIGLQKGESPAKPGFQRSRQPGPRRGDAHRKGDVYLSAGFERRCATRNQYRGFTRLDWPKWGAVL